MKLFWKLPLQLLNVFDSIAKALASVLGRPLAKGCKSGPIKTIMAIYRLSGGLSASMEKFKWEGVYGDLESL